MKKQNICMIISALAVFFLVGMSGTAMAAWTAGPSNLLVISGAPATNYTAVAGQANAVFTIVAGALPGANAKITISLTNGLKFSGNGLTLTAVGGTLVTAAPTTGGTIGTTSATWTVLGAFSAGDTLTLNSGTAAPNGIFDVTSVTPGVNADIKINMLSGAAAQIGTANQSLFADLGSYAFTGMPLLTVTNTKTTDTADVYLSSPYTRLTTGGVTGSTNGLSIKNNAAATSIPTAAISTGKVLISLIGDFSGISSVATGIIVNFTGSSAAGSTTGGTAGFFMINSTKTAAYAVTNAAWPINTTYAVNPIFTWDGTTAQAGRSFTAKVETLVDGTNWLAASYYNQLAQLYVIDRNGSSFTANSFGPLNTIKITDLTGGLPVGGSLVFITAYHEDGTKLAEAAGNQPIVILNNQTIYMTGATMAARFVGSPMKYEVTIQSASVLCTNIKKDATGITETVYTSSGNGAL